MYDEVTNTNNNLVTTNSSLMERVSQMEIPYYRYVRLSALLPDFLKKMILKIMRLIRK